MSEPIIPYQYAYLTGALYLLGIWLFLFWRVKSYRKVMILTGLIFMGLGLIWEYFFWSKDWWKPMTVTGTVLGIEDLIVCFVHVSLPVTAYIYVFNRGSQAIGLGKKKKIEMVYRVAYFLLLIFLLTVFFFLFTDNNSIFITNLMMLLGVILILIQRRDLLRMALGGGFLMLGINFSMIWLGEIFSRGAVDQFWNFGELSGIKILANPLEDALFYFLWGLVATPLAPWLTNGRVNKMEENNLQSDWRKFKEFFCV